MFAHIVRSYQDMVHGHDFCIYRGGALTRHGMQHFGSCSFFIILMLIKNIVLRITETYRNFGVSEFRSFGVSDHIGLRT